MYIKNMNTEIAKKLITDNWKNLSILPRELCNNYNIYRVLKNDRDFMKHVHKWEIDLSNLDRESEDEVSIPEELKKLELMEFRYF
jgi:anti-sigma-K factor RskA